MVCVGGSDQGKIALIGDRKDNAPIGALKEITAVVIVEFMRHDMAAAHQTDRVRCVQTDARGNHVRHPWACCIYQRAGLRHAGPITALQGDVPQAVHTLGPRHFGSGQDGRAPRCGVAGVQHDES